MTDPDGNIRFGEDGLISAAIQDSRSGDLLMVGFMNRDALHATRSSGFVHFWSRSRQKPWKKGETSGHVQRVEEIRINCELNSLLIDVEQVGAVCHDGYDTCYYRRLEPDGSLTTVRDRRFDPRDVYSTVGSPTEGLAGMTRRWWSCYEWLRDHDLSEQSSTSRRLHAATNEHLQRLADELRELAGVLEGTHRHTTTEDDLRLEAGQVLYWLACAGVYGRLTWDGVHPDLALAVHTHDKADDRLLVRLLVGRAAAFDGIETSADAPLLHDTITMIATVVSAHGILPEELIKRDLEEMRSKPYLAELFRSGS